MSFTRKRLAAIGIEAEKHDEIINMYLEEINPVKEERDSLKAERDELKEKADKADVLQKELDAIKDDGYKEKYENLNKEHNEFVKKVELEKSHSAKEAAFKEVLKDIGITEDKNVAKVLKYSNIDELELDDKGKLVNAKDIAKNVKEEWSNEITTHSTKGADVANPPANNGGSGKKTREEILAIKDRLERQKAIAENHELFGF